MPGTKKLLMQLIANCPPIVTVPLGVADARKNTRVCTCYKTFLLDYPTFLLDLIIIMNSFDFRMFSFVCRGRNSDRSTICTLHHKISHLQWMA
jgi:hypothetical protein